jgi:HEAT repeat protein
MAQETFQDEVEALLRVEHFDEAPRQRIMELGDDALDTVKRCATGSSRGEAGFLKSRAILALADWPSDDVLDTIDEVLAQTNLDNRIRATMTLGEIGTHEAVMRLSTFAERADSDLELSSVARALSEVTDESARRALQQLRYQTTSEAVLTDIDDALAD